MGRAALSALTARQAVTSTKVGYSADALQPGLNLQVTKGKSGYSRSWLFRYTSPVTKKRREMGLGPVATRSLADARAEAAKLRLQVLDGIDPKDERDRQRAANAALRASIMTFEMAAAQCIATKQHEWKNAKHTKQWGATLKTYAFPVIGTLPVDQVTTEHMLEVLEPIWTTKTETATRLRQRIETVLDWAKARKLVSGENPASLKGGLGQLLPKARKIKKVKHHPAVPYQQVHVFVRQLREKQGVAGKALEFLLLTASRSSEVLNARWEEFDLVANVWVIPAERMKAGKAHRVPLNTRARAIVQGMRAGRQCDFVFPGPSGKIPLSNAAMLAVMRRMPDYKQYVPHGLRSTFRDWASETTSFANETVELALAHTIKNDAEAAYRRGDQLEKRVKLMEQWADYIDQPRGAGLVVQIGHVVA